MVSAALRRDHDLELSWSEGKGPLADDTAGLTTADTDLMMRECMHDCTGDYAQNQATVRSATPAG